MTSPPGRSDVASDPVGPACPGCGVLAPDAGHPPPAEQHASAGCYALYCRLLARDYVDPEYYRLGHQLVVDTYAAQRAGGTSRREVQTVALCLMTLCLFVEDGVVPTQGPILHKRMVARLLGFIWLQPPPMRGLMTAADLLPATTAEEHGRLARRWGSQVWQAWAPHHAQIRAWNDAVLSTD